MVYVNDFKVGDTVVLRDGTTGAVEKISEYEKGFILELSCFPGGWFCCYADGCQKNFEQTKYDIVEHIPAEEDNVIYVSEIKVGDTIVSRDGSRMIVLDLFPIGPMANRGEIKSVVLDHDGPGHGNVARAYYGNGRCVRNTHGPEGDPAHTFYPEFDIVEHIQNQEVNLFEAEVGDTVIHKNGSKGTIKEIMKVGFLSGYDIALDIDHEDGRNTRLNYMRTGGGSKHGPSECIVHIVKRVPSQDEEYEPSAEWMAKWGYPDGTKWGRKDEEPAQDEMTMRDQFAMSALNGLVIGTNNWRGTSPEELAEVSYSLAEAMMKARKENN